MKTRDQYLNGDVSHEEYYSQFVTAGTRQRVLRWIGLETLKKSTDESFNDIPLAQWDALAVPFSFGTAKKLKEAGDYPTLAGGVCILKCAASQLLQEAKGL